MNDQSGGNKIFPIFAALQKQQQQRERQLAEGRQIRTADEQSAEAARLAAANAVPPPRGPGRPPKQRPIDLTDNDAQPQKLAAKRKFNAEETVAAAEHLGKKRYKSWSDDDKTVALSVVAQMNGNRANAMR